MKKIAWSLLVWAVWSVTPLRAQEPPSVTVYVSPDRLEHPVRIGLLPYYSHWVELGKLAQQSAIQVFATQYPGITLCEGGKTSDVVIWLTPRIRYNPAVGLVYVEARLSVHLGDGRPLGKYKAWAEHQAPLGSIYMDKVVQQAMDAAMQEVARQFDNDTAARQMLDQALGKGIHPVACGFMSLLGQGINSKED